MQNETSIKLDIKTTRISKDKKRAYYLIDKELLANFKETCKANNLKQVRLIESFMQSFINSVNDENNKEAN